LSSFRGFDEQGIDPDHIGRGAGGLHEAQTGSSHAVACSRKGWVERMLFNGLAMATLPFAGRPL
jgi:hypothetical protein